MAVSLAEERNGWLEVNCHSKAFLSPWTGCDKGEGCGEREKKKERERQAEVPKEDLRVSCLKALLASFECELACVSPSIFVLVYRLEGGLITTFENEAAAVRRRGFSLYWL